MATATPEPLFAEPTDYVESSAVRETAVGLINRIPTVQATVADLRIAFCERLGEPSGEGESILAACVKASPLWRDRAGDDVVIWVWQAVWATLEPRQQEALVLHELLHIDRTEKGAVKLRKHDLEEFSMVVHQYGAWKGDIGAFLHAAELHDAGKVTRLPAGRERRRPGTREPVVTS